MGGAHIDSINEFVFVHVGGWVWVRIMFRCCHLEMFHLCVCPCFDGLIILSQQFPKSAPPESSNQHFGAQTVHTRFRQYPRHRTSICCQARSTVSVLLGTQTWY